MGFSELLLKLVMASVLTLMHFFFRIQLYFIEELNYTFFFFNFAPERIVNNLTRVEQQYLFDIKLYRVAFRQETSWEQHFSIFVDI
jgi:hypothetical protein